MGKWEWYRIMESTNDTQNGINNQVNETNNGGNGVNEFNGMHHYGNLNGSPNELQEQCNECIDNREWDAKWNQN